MKSTKCTTNPTSSGVIDMTVRSTNQETSLLNSPPSQCTPHLLSSLCKVQSRVCSHRIALSIYNIQGYPDPGTHIYVCTKSYNFIQIRCIHTTGV